MQLLSAYSLQPGVLPYLLAGLVALGMGTGVLLYERFTPASRRFFALAAVMSGWLLSYAASTAAEPSAVREIWYRVGLALTAVGVPLLYDLTLHLTGRRRPWMRIAVWAGAVAMAAVAAGPLTAGISALLYRSGLAGWGLVALVYVAYLAATLGLVVSEFWRAYRRSRSPVERQRHVLMLTAILMGSLALVDFFVPAHATLPSGVTPLAVAAALALMGVAGTRYRTFATSAQFATDEVLRAMGDAVLVCDVSGSVRVANAEAERLLGVDLSELIGSHVGRWLKGTDGAGGPVRPGESMATTVLVQDRAMVLWPASGDSIDVSVSIEPIAAAGERRGLVIVARDIRDRLEAERALQASERRYSSLFWHNPAILYEFDLEGRFVAANPVAETLLGWTAEELMGQPLSDVIDPADLEKAGEVFVAVLGGDPREYEMAVTRRDGETREIRGVSIPIFDHGEVVGAFGVALDVTEQTRVKQELEVQRRYFADLFEGSPEGIVLVEAESDRVLRVNQEFTRMFGYTAEEAVGRNLNDLIVPDTLRWEGTDLNSSARNDGRVKAETTRRRKDGSTVHVSVLARHLQIPGEPEQLYGVYRDISDRMETERALQDREEELRHAQRLEAVGKLAGGVAHDFNNLLTVINGHARFALESIGPGEPVEKDLLEIEKAGARAASLTQQLLAYSRRQVLHPQLLDPNAVVMEVKGMLGRLIGEHIRVETRFTTDEVRVRVDRGQLEQVLVNLVVNARDAMPEGGSLTLETGTLTLPPEDPRLERWEIEPGDYVRVRVVDTGTGMDPDTLAHAFEPFYTTKPQGKGTGLGLATVFGIVKQSGGHVVVSSQLGAGTICDVILPRSMAEAPSASRELQEDAPERPRGTVLVVEDEAAVRKLTVRVLERVGCTVLSAENGDRALEVIEGHEGAFDLVITDLVMPGMGGRELARELRDRYPDLPILFMSGYDEEFSPDEGDHSFLAKPFTPADLARRAAAVMRGDPVDSAP